ncbi:hypothetical protein EO244_05960 [Ancylomarina salipaludis]|uniref:Uncharacterized protein n=1 Tax=Ancylomarina salipaludis TaxID=2501299 RepID=A0A4Q1JP19_9BACT|nr:hypothetical protein [Ancylomarina salipaludis]RXQ95851.1 hypothetical protein EO244_05960 [Ancylomarina salipaludis]
MKKIYYLLLLVLISCSSNEESISPNEEEYTKEEILIEKIKKIKIVSEFGLQSNELEEKLKSYGYTLSQDEDNILVITPENTYGKYHTLIKYNGDIVCPIKGYSFKIYENTEGDGEPSIVQEFFYENNQNYSTNNPFFQVQISFEKVSENTYELVKNWIKELGIVTASFEQVNNLTYTKERASQSNLIVEIGEHSNFVFKDVVFVRIYENKTPIYAQ